MRCHYEVLGVPVNATNEDIKISYRKLALQWHPDKNLQNLEEAKEQFQLIQQAYDVLSDPHERAWYDRHKDSILKGGIDEDYKDESVDVFQYFNTGCFHGYDDSEKSFYSVYREVFDRIVAEDRAFIDEEIDIPSFGYSNSSYEEVVHVFYAYWQSYFTAKSYSWIEKYDIREAPNRQVVRLMEKENKKLRDQAKKKRNEEVRHLVSYVRKRDKRVQAYRKVLEAKAEQNYRKAQEQRRKQIQERQKKLAEVKESEWASMSQLEDGLKEIEANLSKEFGDDSTCTGSENDVSGDEENVDDTYCVACDKSFRSAKTMRNHENSKKHKENVALLKEIMKGEDEQLHSEVNEQNDGENEENLSCSPPLSAEISEEETEIQNDINRQKKKKKRKGAKIPVVQYESDDGLPDLTNIEQEIVENYSSLADRNIDSPSDKHELPSRTSERETRGKKKKNSKKNIPVQDVESGDEKVSVAAGTNNENNPESSCTETTDVPTTTESIPLLKNKKTKEMKKKTAKQMTEDVSKEQNSNRCEKCQCEFPSRNKLFDHLKDAGHAMYIPSRRVDEGPGRSDAPEEISKRKQKKSKR